MLRAVWATVPRAVWNNGTCVGIEEKPPNTQKTPGLQVCDIRARSGLMALQARGWTDGTLSDSTAWRPRA